MNDELNRLAERLNMQLLAKGMLMASAESCTGGWIAKAMTDIAGSSGCFDRAFITYSNQAKEEMLGVSTATLVQQGAVSEEVVSEMVRGALDRSNASVAVAVSGIAGPGGGTEDKPVGTVWIAWGVGDAVRKTSKEQFEGDREEVRYQTVVTALQGVLDLID